MKDNYYQIIITIEHASSKISILLFFEAKHKLPILQYIVASFLMSFEEICQLCFQCSIIRNSRKDMNCISLLFIQANTNSTGH